MILIDDKQNIVADTKKTLNKNEDLEILKKPSLNLCCLKIKTQKILMIFKLQNMKQLHPKKLLWIF